MHFSTLTSVYLSIFSMDFSIETITSVPPVDSTHVDRQQECQEQSIAEVLQSEDAVLINDLDDEIADTLDSLDAVKCFTEIHGDKQMNVMLIELIRKMKTLKLQSPIRMIFKK